MTWLPSPKHRPSLPADSGIAWSAPFVASNDTKIIFLVVVQGHFRANSFQLSCPDGLWLAIDQDSLCSLKFINSFSLFKQFI